MPARQNIIVVITRFTWDRVRHVFVRLGPIVEKWVGSVKSLLMVDFSMMREHQVEDAFAGVVPDVSDHEILVLLPTCEGAGRLLFFSQGRL